MSPLEIVFNILLIAATIPVAIFVACFVWALIVMGLIELSVYLEKIFKKDA